MRRHTEITNRAALAASAPPAARLSLTLPCLIVGGGLLAYPFQRIRTAQPAAMAAAPAVIQAQETPAPDPETEGPLPMYASLHERALQHHSAAAAARLLNTLDAQAHRQGGYANISAAELRILRASLEKEKALPPRPKPAPMPILPGPAQPLSPSAY